MDALTPNRRPESARALLAAIQCPGYARMFTPSRLNQRHCTPSCRAQASRIIAVARRERLLEQLDPGDRGRAE